MRQTSTRTSRNIELRNTWSSLNPTTRYKQRGSLLSLGLRSCPQRITSGAVPILALPAVDTYLQARPASAVPGPRPRPTPSKNGQLSRNVPVPDETLLIRPWAPVCAISAPLLNTNLLSRCDLQAATSVRHLIAIDSESYPVQHSRDVHYRGQSTTDRKPSSSVTHN